MILIDATEIMVIASLSDKAHDCVAEVNDHFLQYLCEVETKIILNQIFGTYEIADFDPKVRW